MNQFQVYLFTISLYSIVLVLDIIQYNNLIIITSHLLILHSLCSSFLWFSDNGYGFQFIFNMPASMSSKLNFEQFPVSDCYKIIYPPSGKSANFNSQRWNFSSKPYKRRLPVNRSGFMEIDFGPRLDLILMHRSN